MASGPNDFDVVVIGGGPAGSTVATLTARQGLRVAVFEKQTFPRFHIGESLLPASVPIFEELGVHEKIKSLFIRKPGGKWYYGDRPVAGDFARGRDDTSFARTPHSYMVRRAEFDDLLLKNAESAGAAVHIGWSVADVIQEGEKVVGVVVKDQSQQARTIRCDMVFDCSGFGAVLAKKFNIRKENRLKRMAVFGHYATRAVNEDLKNGWFVGQLVHDGWIWLIPLKDDLISIGVVIPVEKYKSAQTSPQAFLEHYMRTVPIVRSGITPKPELQGPVHLYGNLGHTTSRAFGDGWVLVGDAAFFIDPCYSSGVHMALVTAKGAVAAYLERRRSGNGYAEAFAGYERELRRDEKLVLRFVDSFYMHSRNRFLKWLIPAMNTDRITRDFITFTGGDFGGRPGLVNMVYFTSKVLSALIPIPTRDEAADMDLGLA